MRSILAFALLTSVVPAAAYGQAAAPAPAASAAAAAGHYTTADTDIGTLLDNPASKAVIVKYAPAIAANPQIGMARGMTLKAVQSYAGDSLTDDVLAKIDADLAKLPVKK